MRALPCIVLALSCSAAQAQFEEDVTHPLIVGNNSTAAIRTVQNSTRNDGTAFADTEIQHSIDPTTGWDYFGLYTFVRALGSDNTSEATVYATLMTEERSIVRWVMFGPGRVDLTGPGADYHVVNAPSPQMPGIELGPGTYQLTLSQSLVSGQYNDTASVEAFVFVVPEPSAWALAAILLLLFVVPFAVRNRIAIAR
jgi:hypothetical protein